MKRLWWVLALLVLISLPITAGIITVNKFEDEMLECISLAEKTISSEDYKSAKKYAEKIEDTFAKKEGVISLFADHEMVENIGVSVARLSSLATKETASEFLGECQSAKIMLRHLVNDQLPLMHNIL